MDHAPADERLDVLVVELERVIAVLLHIVQLSKLGADRCETETNVMR